MNKTLKYLWTAVITACLALALSGSNARANGQLGTGNFTDPLPPPVTTAAPGGGGLGSGSASNGPDAAGSSNIVSDIGDFLISLFG